MFTEKELHYLSDTDFLLTKAVVSEKVGSLLHQTHEQLKAYLATQNLRLPPGVKARSGKISRGENYQRLPYMVLDYPRKFTQDDVFALRTLFWWGNFFSVTFQLGGASWHRYRSALTRNVATLSSLNVSLCIADDPWQHHREPYYYRPLQGVDTDTVLQLLEQQNFLKIAVFISLEDWKLLPQQARQFFQKMIRLTEL